MTDLTGYAQCVECGIVGKPPLSHSCTEVTLQRAAVVEEQARRARAMLAPVPGSETPGEELELGRID